MTIPAWFQKDVYLADKLEQMRESNANYTASILNEVFGAAGYGGDEGAYRHFIDYGADEGLTPNAWFDPDVYCRSKAVQYYGLSGGASYAQAQAMRDAMRDAGLNPWTHYTLYGTAEGIDPSLSFSTNTYLTAKLAQLIFSDSSWQDKTITDLKEFFAEAGLNALQHYYMYGKYEELPGFHNPGVTPPTIPEDDYGPYEAAPGVNNHINTSLFNSVHYRVHANADSWSLHGAGGSNTITMGGVNSMLRLAGGMLAENYGSNTLVGPVNGQISVGAGDDEHSLYASNGGQNTVSSSGSGGVILNFEGGLCARGGGNNIALGDGDNVTSVEADNDGFSLFATGPGSANALSFGGGRNVLTLRGDMRAETGGVNTISMGNGNGVLSVEGAVSANTGENRIGMGAGNDVLKIKELGSGTEITLGDGADMLVVTGNFSDSGVSVSGGEGVDALCLELYEGSEQFSLTELNSTVNGFEMISLLGERANTLTVRDIAGWGETLDTSLRFAWYKGLTYNTLEQAERVLRIMGDEADTLALGRTWSEAGEVHLNGVAHTAYSANGDYILVQQDMYVTFA